MIAGTLNANGKAAGSATQQDAETGMLVAFGGNRSSGPIDVATSVLAHSGPHGRQDFASETFVFTGDGVIADPIGASEAKTYTHEGTTFRLHSCVGVCATGEKTHALTTRRACEEDGTGRGTPIVPHFGDKAALPFDTTQITSKSNYSRPKAGDPCHPLASGAHPPAVAFSDSAAAHSYGVAQTVEHTPPLRGGQGGNVIPAVVSFAQNQIGEVRVNADVMGTVNQNQNASGRNTPMVFSNRTRDGIKVPEVMKDGVVPALTNPGNGGRADAVNIASAMQVRRLCPSECEALQGFPIGYTDVPYRKKPAADGPRYRALGNSMAVPCMWWLGGRIQKATQP